VLDYSTQIADFWEVHGIDFGGGSIYVSGVIPVTLEDPVTGEPVGTFDRPIVRKLDVDSGLQQGQVIITDPIIEADSAPQVDVLHEGGTLYVTNPTGVDGQKIVLIDAGTMEQVGGFGSFPGLPTAPQPGELFGPRRFVAVNNRRITVIDEYANPEITGTPENYDRLVQFDPDQDNWETFGSTGFGTGEFQFFEQDLC
jgi:hypothetical protein